MAGLDAQNLLLHWLQAGLVAAAAGVASAALPLRPARLRLFFWQATLLVCLVLPLVQPRRPIARAPVRVEATLAVPAVTAAEAGSVSTTAPWMPLLPVLVAAGAALRLAWMAAGLVGLRRLRRAARPFVLPPDISDAQERLGVRASVLLADDRGPLTFGWRDPVVLLPSAIVDLDEAARRAVVLHELLHVRRRDWLVALAEEMAVALLWFHPWSWWIRRRIRLARELAVDREVVAFTGAARPYAAGLLEMAGHRTPRLAPVAGLCGRELRVRIESLFEEVVMSPTRSVVTITSLLLSLAGAALAGVLVFPLRGAAAHELVAAGRDGQPGGASLRVDSSRRALALVPPVYPPAAVQVGLEGAILVELTVSADGEVAGFSTRGSAEPVLIDSALTAVRRWRFERGAATSVLTAEIRYTLQRRGEEVRPHVIVYVRDGGFPDLDAATLGSEAGEPPVRVGGAVKPPRKIKHVSPAYPAEAEAAGLRGVVILEATIGADGRVKAVKVLRSVHPLLDEAAAAAIRQWEFEPVVLDGRPVPILMTTTVSFSR
ncbi:MAG TPA: M56 family metallopeptidase [Vicinamibacterales bacterium]|nr:M56 family metallopeptidase [Vicinamibacterales bacterium]